MADENDSIIDQALEVATQVDQALAALNSRQQQLRNLMSGMTTHEQHNFRKKLAKQTKLFDEEEE
ncbi:MAG: hypothetical protein KAS04_04540 [Candidatus Aenigmarchaeota archaeon]|nr:hypothetical protein [Candidatus Aenigmarchaeota archaeon]